MGKQEILERSWKHLTFKIRHQAGHGDACMWHQHLRGRLRKIKATHGYIGNLRLAWATWGHASKQYRARRWLNSWRHLLLQKPDGPKFYPQNSCKNLEEGSKRPGSIILLGEWQGQEDSLETCWPVNLEYPKQQKREALPWKSGKDEPNPKSYLLTSIHSRGRLKPTFTHTYTPRK